MGNKTSATNVGVDITPPNNWETDTYYLENDDVYASNSLYECIVDHRSGVFATDLTASKWQQKGFGPGASPSFTSVTITGLTANTYLSANGTKVVTSVTSVNNAVAITGSAGAPSLSTDIPTAVTIGSGYIYRGSGTDVPVLDGGTGASTTTNARSNLGLAIGSDVQAFHLNLTSVSGLTYASESYVKMTAANTFAIETLANTRINLIDDAGTGTGDLWSADNIDTKITQGRTWRETVLSKEQLANPAGVGAILQSTVVMFNGQPTATDTFTITDGTTTEVYTFLAAKVNPFEVAIAGTPDLTMANLVIEIINQSANWSATSLTNMESIWAATGTVGLIRRKTMASSSFPDRIYGTITGNIIRYVNYTNEDDYTKVTSNAIPSSDPTTKTFGFGRNDLRSGESHSTLDDNEYWLWDADGTIWLQTDAGQVTVASIGAQTYDDGLLSLAGLTYASDSFIKVTATDTYAIRTLSETRTDLGLNTGDTPQFARLGIGAAAHGSELLILGATTAVSSILNEDDLTSNSATALATQQSIKSYIDNSVGIEINYYLNNTVSDIGAGYYDMTNVELGGGESTISIPGLSASTDDQPLINFITLLGEPGVLVFPIGITELHFHAEKTAGSSNTVVYVKIYKRATGGAETQIATSEVSGLITSKRDVVIHANNSVDIDLLTTDRIVVKFFANCGSGSGATLAIYQEGTTVSRAAFPSTTEILSQIFIRQDGIKPFTGDQTWGDGLAIQTGIVDDDNVIFKAVSNTPNTLTEVARLSGAVTPTFDLLAGKLTGGFDANSQAITNVVTQPPADVNTVPATTTFVSNVLRWVQIPVNFSDFATTSTTNTITGYNLELYEAIVGVAILFNESFKGGGITAYTLSVGITGTLQKYANNFDVWQTTGNTVFGIGNNIAVQIENTAVPTEIKITAISTSANLDQAGTGEAMIQLLISTLTP